MPLLTAMADNCASHASHLHPALPGARVLDPGDVIIADSGLADDTFNLVCRARFADTCADRRVGEVLEAVRATGRPFSWWVGPTPGPIRMPTSGPATAPADLGARLRAHGLAATESEEAMVASLAESPAPAAPSELEIAVVDTPAALADYAGLLAANWSPPAPAVRAFFADTAAAILAGDCASTFVVGRVAGRPVAGAEVHLAAGVAGLYGVATLAGDRRRGFGAAVTLAALEVARRSGYAHAVLQASADGAPMYRRLGFSTVASYTEYGVG